ncbi:HAMP domain-containing sensor histidine kinase [uncultured Subdoligranulum sp.]|uniref:HAMP domain-containing sensor histidine kinase n=1 Tax=uncultured Subdoligranulum sp. TaxID=512298 RepID=UPI0025D6FAF3|nr:HAMP domain-containing sensor histidine kinase [uncultured Subdoligranulum sp.]
MAKTSIIQRWIKGSLLIMVLVLVAAEAIFLYNSYRELYGGVQHAIENRFSTIAGRLQATGTAGDSMETSESRAQALRRTVEQFDEKDKFEFMLLDAQGVILATSSGTMTQDLTNGADFVQALSSASGVGRAIFTTPQGERVMAVTSLVPYTAGNIAAMRMVTSLTLVDRQWSQYVAVSAGIGVLAFLLMLWSGLFFVRSIVRPLGEVEATATRIARGDLKARLPDTKYNDEIGRLCSTINQMAEDLAETDRLKNEFISSVSHELRTPLTSIKGWVETIKNIDDPTNENYRRGLAIIGTETDRLYTMVEELLDFSRLQNGIKLNCEVLDLVAEATDAALFVEARIQQEGLHFVYEEPPDPYPVWADPARLRQVFVNVFDNAIKYSDPGGTIFFTLTRTPVTVTAAIRDQGRGIAPDDLDKVKQKFFKAQNSVRGSGIGLAVVDEIVKALGGKVDIESALGQGTTVSITLPVYHPGQEHLHEKI